MAISYIIVYQNQELDTGKYNTKLNNVQILPDFDMHSLTCVCMCVYAVVYIFILWVNSCKHCCNQDKQPFLQYKETPLCNPLTHQSLPSGMIIVSYLQFPQSLTDLSVSLPQKNASCNYGMKVPTCWS